MEQLRKTFSRYDMVCDAPSGSSGLEIIRMPYFFREKKGRETDFAHVHSFYEIIWFQEGEGVHHIDFNDYPVTSGNIFFISPGQVHSFDERHDQKGIVIKLCDEFLNADNNDETSYFKYSVFNSFDAPPYCHIGEDDTAKLLSIAGEMEQELRHAGAIGHKEYLQSLVRMFMITVKRSSKNNGDGKVINPNKTSHRTFLAFRRQLEANFRKYHTVKEYASLLNISTKTLTNYVAECSPYSPLEIINGRIALEAKRLLRYSNLMNKEIAFKLGFDDPSYFVKFFKRQAHCSPANYRNPT